MKYFFKTKNIISTYKSIFHELFVITIKSKARFVIVITSYTLSTRCPLTNNLLYDLIIKYDKIPRRVLSN